MTADPPLSGEGRQQARKLAAYLGSEAIDAVWSSTMRRAVQTADPLARMSNLDVLTHEGLCEFDRHSGEYVPTEILKLENYEAWKALAASPVDDLAAFQAQVVASLETIIDGNPGRRVAVFCHGGVINVWTAHVLGMPARLFFEPTYTSIHRFACSRGGARSILSLNERAHLRAPAAPGAALASQSRAGLT